MARIAGVNVPDNKHTVVALTHIFGIGRSTALKLCRVCKVAPATPIKALAEADLGRLRTEIRKHTTEGDLRRQYSMNIKRLIDLGTYRGTRHKFHLPVRGQRTKTNARTRKGPVRLIKK